MESINPMPPVHRRRWIIHHPLATPLFPAAIVFRNVEQGGDVRTSIPPPTHPFTHRLPAAGHENRNHVHMQYGTSRQAAPAQTT